ncbi:hypothetical protein SKAU_G00092500 [Synaphobranchus kaupii]|uniref:Multidrug and toxin extrusion protein 1 n=1 Tax=Synaphobranchus kaupii TaxID=118154 RepID=A0A9Q1FX45_SYNKA|nr:hypothetical protein SKAU_G00092500 [Synaphobranchus kaupii]
MNTESIFLAVKQSPEVARLSQTYVKIFMPALPGIIWPQVITGIVVNILNALINYIFLFVLDLGIVGSAAASTISQYCLAVFLFAYILCKGLHRPTWGGWSMECLQEWGSFIRLAIPSMFMICLEWWIYEIGAVLAGLISEVELGAQSIIYVLGSVAYKIPLGFSIAASVRVGNALGAGNIQQAHLSSKVSIIYTAVICIGVAVIIGALKDVISFVFTNDEQIRRRVGEVMVVYAPLHFLEAIVCVTGGILRGVAKQKICALSNLVCYYFVGTPIGVSLMFPAKLGITGLWTGIFICVFLLAGFCLTIIQKLDWKKAAKEVRPPSSICTILHTDCL